MKNIILKNVIASLIIAIPFGFLSMTIASSNAGIIESWLEAFTYPGFWGFYIKSFLWFFWACFLSISIFTFILKK